MSYKKNNWLIQYKNYGFDLFHEDVLVKERNLMFKNY